MFRMFQCGMLTKKDILPKYKAEALTKLDNYCHARLGGGWCHFNVVYLELSGTE